MRSPFNYFLLTLLVIILDQAIKLWMHFDVIPNHFGEIDLIPDIFKLHYVLNPGMAFGMELGGSVGKLALTLFRLLACGGIVWYMFKLVGQGAHTGLLWSLAAILGGALGNVIDSIFYGVFLKGNAIEGAPTPWFHGQVIDMFYAVGLDGYWPQWVPFMGGKYNATPIFNFADAAIFCGVAAILLFQRKFLETEILEPVLDEEMEQHLHQPQSPNSQTEIPKQTEYKPNKDTDETL